MPKTTMIQKLAKEMQEMQEKLQQMQEMQEKFQQMKKMMQKLIGQKEKSAKSPKIKTTPPQNNTDLIDDELNLEAENATSTLILKFYCKIPEDYDMTRVRKTIPDPRDPTKMLVEKKEKRVVMLDKDAKGLPKLSVIGEDKFESLQIVLQKGEAVSKLKVTQQKKKWKLTMQQISHSYSISLHSKQ
jgi:hypothetical protein